MGIYFSIPLANLSILKISTTTNMQLIPNICILHLDIPTWDVLLAFRLYYGRSQTHDLPTVQPISVILLSVDKFGVDFSSRVPF